jgi:hypothetical protein
MYPTQNGFVLGTRYRIDGFAFKRLRMDHSPFFHCSVLLDCFRRWQMAMLNTRMSVIQCLHRSDAREHVHISLHFRAWRAQTLSHKVRSYWPLQMSTATHLILQAEAGASHILSSSDGYQVLDSAHSFPSFFPSHRAGASDFSGRLGF